MSDLRKNLEKIAHQLERAHYLSAVASGPGNNPREKVYKAASIAAEYLAAATGTAGDTGLVFRVFEEVLASLESSPAMFEMLESGTSGSSKDLDTRVAEFRSTLLAPREE